MHLTVLACDLDGTLANHGKVASETWEMLRQAKTAGLTKSIEPLVLDAPKSTRGDFENWLQDVLYDKELTRLVKKVNSRNLRGEKLRHALLEVVINRYEELDKLT